MGAIDAIVAGHVSSLNVMAAKWRAGYPLAKEEFESLCKNEEENIKSLEAYIAKVAQMIAKLVQMLKKAFADMVAAQNALQAAKARLRTAKPGSSEESAAQAEVARCEAAYQKARERHLKITEEKKKKEDFKAHLEKDLEKWKDALSQIRKAGEERLRELERQGQLLDAKMNEAIRRTREGMSLGA